MNQPSFSVPGGLPDIAAGRHIGPDSGGCLMEIVSVLAGEPWSDSPRCTHPALGEVGRLVTDGSSAGGRAVLLPLAVELVGVRGGDARITPSLVVLAIELAGTARTARRELATARRRLRALEAGGPRARWQRLTDPLYRRGPAQRALARAVEAMSTGRPLEPGAPDPDGDARLRALLEESLRVTGELLGFRTASRPPAGIPVHLA